MLARFIADSGCDIPSLKREVSSIKLLPLFMSINGSPYYENVNITLDKISPDSLALISEPVIPKQVYLEAILDAQRDGCSDIFIITPDKHLFGLYKEASKAASLYLRKKTSAGTKVHVLDSGTFSIGYGVPLASVVLDYEAGKLKTTDEIKKALSKRLSEAVMFCKSSFGCRVFKKLLLAQKAEFSPCAEAFVMYKGTCERLTELPEEENKRKMNKVLKTLRKNEYISFFTLNSRRTAEKELDKLFLNLSDLLAKVDIVTSRRAKLGISAAYIAGDELRLMLLIPARNFELIDEVAL